MNPQLLWLIPILPFAGFLINGTIGRKLARPAVTAIALLFTIYPAYIVLRLWMFMKEAGAPLSLSVATHPWIAVSGFHVDFAFTVDHLTLVMLCIVTGVGFLIHLYSAGYMAHEEGYWRYFAYLNLFMFFMLVLVLASSFLLLFVGWEGVGLASYLLIGFYFTKDSAANAGKKAFIVNRIGDFGFLLAMFLLIAHFGSLDFTNVFAHITALPPGPCRFLTPIALLLVLGAAGKSAQIPLYIWLPDAMEGPTPVSALIHAATMVTAGIYMVARCHILFDRSPATLTVIACIGAATAILAATIGMVQHDIKRVLAYSTISQLGYMFLACGVGAYSAGIFHLMTHAFFKALLFLAAGSVIHALSGEQDMRSMGGLRKRIPTTFWTMTAGVFAIAGIYPFAGFFSKDAILYEAFQHGTFGKSLYFVGLVTALLTSFYMFRLWYLAFFGESRADSHDFESHGAAVHSRSDSKLVLEAEEPHHVHESPWIMLAPLVILAALSVAGGWIGIERFGSFLAPVVGPVVDPTLEPGGKMLDVTLSVIAVAVAILGWFVADLFYRRKNDRPAKLAAALPGAYNLLVKKYAIDELYNATIVRPILLGSRYILGGLGEGAIIRGSAWLLAGVTTLLGEWLRRWQSGNLRSYSAWLAAGAAVLLLFAASYYLGSNGMDIHINWAGR